MRLALALTFSLGCTAELDPDLPVQEAVDDLLARWTTEDRGGIAVIVERDGETVVRSHLGLADRETGAPMTPGTPSYAASLSKPITATLVLQLHDEGLLSLDAPLSDHLPELPARLGKISARHLLTHEGGVPDWIGLAGGRTQCLDELDGTTNEDVVDLLVAHGEVDFPAGTDAAYSNGGYVLLAELAEAASGQPMDALVAERIAAPLGLEATWVITRGTPDPLDRAVGTKRSGKPCDYGLWTTGAGGVVASAEDLVTLGRAWHDDALLSADLRDDALAPVGPALSGDATGHGLGWFVGDRAQGQVAWHTGHFAGFANVWMVAPEAGLTIVALSNGSTPQVAGLAEELLAHPDLQP